MEPHSKMDVKMQNFGKLYKAALSARILLALLLIALPFSFGGKTLASQLTEQNKIDYLLTATGSSDLVFIREGREYSGKEAETHLQKKLAMTGWRVHTADDFITYVASKSSMTGRPYYVRLTDGTEMESETWLRSKLAELK
jgi:hypothetical protein